MKQVHSNAGFLENVCPAAVPPEKERRRPTQSGTYIARLIQTIEDSLAKLGVDVASDAEKNSRLIEQMAVIIHDSMSVSTRNYHSVQHVFDVAEGVADDPVAVLAAFFHDCVYYIVDGGIELQREHLKIGETAFAKGGKLPEYRVQGTKGTDTILRMVESCFGYPPDTVVTHRNGLNEFLSAVLCARQLEAFLPLRTLAKIVCCIEATIPFRPMTLDENGHKISCFDRLFEQMKVTSDNFNLDMSEEEIVVDVQRAVLVANEDVANFGTEDVLWFLDNTWSLLPETNEALRQHFLYSVQNFQFAVYKMYGFFNFLQADVVFHQYHGVPTKEVLEERRRNTAINLKLGRKYVGAKLLSLSVLMAFAELSGGDAPVSLFMGDLPSRHRQDSRPLCPLRDLPKPPDEIERDSTVYQILSEGRRSETSFDIRQSPLAAYLYGHLGDEVVNTLVQKTHPQWESLYPMTNETAAALLKELPKDCVSALGTRLASVAISRKEALEKVIQDITAEDC